MAKPKRTGSECESCEGRGFRWKGALGPAKNVTIIERCGKCKVFDSDQAAARRIAASPSSGYYTWGTVRDPRLSRVVIVVIKAGG